MPKFFKSVGNFLFGTPEKHKRVSTLLPGQQPLLDQAVQAGLQPGAGGAFGTAADFFRDLLSPDSQTAQQMSAPEMRRFSEQIIPDLSEQFAGMGAGGLSSSGFRNAGIAAGTDLSERLGAIRANLRQQGAQGLMNIGQQGLRNYSQDVMTQPGTPGFLNQIAPTFGSAFGGPIGNVTGNWLSSAFGGNKVGMNTSPYGQQNPQASPNFQLPNRGF